MGARVRTLGTGIRTGIGTGIGTGLGAIQELEPLEQELEPLEQELEKDLESEAEPLEQELEQELKQESEPLQKLNQKLEQELIILILIWPFGTQHVCLPKINLYGIT